MEPFLAQAIPQSSGTPSTADHLATIAAQLALLPASKVGQAQFANDLASVATTLEGQKAATAALNLKLDFLRARVAALGKGPPKQADDAASSSDDATDQDQRGNSAHSATGEDKTRLRSSSPPTHVQPSDDRARVPSNPSRPSPHSMATPSFSVEELVLLRLAGLTARASRFLYASSEGGEVLATAIRVKPSAIRRRGLALSPL